MSSTTSIPQPPAIPFLGNINTVDTELPIRSFRLLAQQYGEIYQLNMFGNQVVHINSQKLVQEVSDDKRFVKVVRGSLMEVRNLAGDGLFTSQTDEPNWGKAHRILMPAFGPAAIRTMFDDMRDICSQLLLKWDRFGTDHEFDPSHDFTCLTFDTIALCSMSHRLNSFYTSTAPPFTQNMVDVLSESNYRFMTPTVVKSVQNVLTGRNDKYVKAIENMHAFAQKIIDDRKARSLPSDAKKDLLTLMLEGEDPQTHEKLSEKNILFNLLTFLIAGHETTSGMLTFTTYFLLKNPSTLQKLREEVDSVTDGGARPVTLEEIGKMPYLVAVMRESLRLAPTASARAVAPKEDTTITGNNGTYFVKKGQTIVVHPSESQIDPLVWGEDANQFKPERMLDGKFEALPPHAWQPFGFGMRGCIGRAFAWQEILLVLSSIVQTFDMYMADPSYTLEIRQALTIKPKNFNIRVKRRLGRSPLIYSVPAAVFNGENGAMAIDGIGSGAGVVGGSTKGGETEGKIVHVLYGSNTGTSEAFAQRLVTDAVDHGFKADLGSLDSAASRLPTDGPVLIVTASFEGEPADNATLFFSYLSNLPSSSAFKASPNSPLLKDVKFSVFGCGNKEWVRTYQRIPTLIDEMMVKYGAERLMERGEADAASSSFFQDFDEYENKLWAVLEKRFGTSQIKSTAQGESFDVQFVDTNERAAILRQKDLNVGKVIDNRLLTKPTTPVKRHVEFQLPEGAMYSAGDYLAILPSNPPNTIKRALARFGLTPEQEIVINSATPTTFPVNKPVSVEQLLKGYVELSQPATTRDLQILIAASKDKSTRNELEALSQNYQENILTKRISVLDILEEKRDINISFASFLKMLPPMRIRQYSISSSPLVDAERVSLTISVVDAPALSGRDRQFLGVGSNYLANLRSGDLVHMVVRPSNAVFHLPMDPLIPVVMFSAGSGMAPFRAFMQERSAQKKSGRKVGKMLLFFGCRSPEEDFLYSESDLAAWKAEGVIDVRPAFSRKIEVSNGCKYVQDRIWHDRADITAYYDEGAKFYTCGSRKAANGIKEVCVKIIQTNNPSFSDEKAAAAAFEKVQKERYATDIFD